MLSPLQLPNIPAELGGIILAALSIVLTILLRFYDARDKREEKRVNRIRPFLLEVRRSSTTLLEHSQLQRRKKRETSSKLQS